MSFFDDYKALQEKKRKVKMLQDLGEISTKAFSLQETDFTVPAEECFQSTLEVKKKINSINNDIKKFDDLKSTIENAGGTLETQGDEALKKAQELTALQDELRIKVLELKKMMQSEHIYSQMKYNALETLQKEINGLQEFLNEKHFNEGSEKSSKKVIMDEKWGKKLDENPLDLTKHDATKESHLIISTYDWNKNKFEIFSNIYNKKTVHENIKLNRAQIFEAVDMMQNADHYIALWERNLNILKNNPHDANAKKYEKYGPLLERLKAARQKNFTRPEVMELKVKNTRKGLNMTIDCKSRDGKQAMLDLLIEYSKIVEKLEQRAQADFEAELDVPRLGN